MVDKETLTFQLRVMDKEELKKYNDSVKFRVTIAYQISFDEFKTWYKIDPHTNIYQIVDIYLEKNNKLRSKNA